jgi:eukaryotic-like serine/threonine-protein kinase
MNQNDSATTQQRVRAAFDQLLDVPDEDRDAAIDDLHLSDEERGLVRQLLDGLTKQRLFTRGAVDWATQLGSVDYIEGMIGKRLGACELVRLIGSGGSSIVFFAQRHVGETRQDVAVKLLNSGLMSSEAQRRFRREQIILSRFTHPNIARLLDAGLSDAGTPYIVMEYVEGIDIVSHAESKSLDARARINLLVDTCRAVDAAHRELVVHRDLKPSNVLVTTDGRVKVLDFGIAKLIDDDLAQTATQHVVLTPAYAAPEQFRPGPVATSMDVYSLGVLASELLLGGRLGADATLPTNDSSTTWQRWRRLDSELSHILRATLASEPHRRYSSAGHLADDLVRYLNREPLQIVPISGWYRLRKFASRHRVAVSAAGLVVLAILLGTAGIVYQWRNARNQAHIAQEQATRAGAIRDFLVSVFQAGKADRPVDKQPSIADIVLDAEKRLQADEKLDAQLKVDLLLTLADVANSVGAFDRSEGLLDQVALTAQSGSADAKEADLQVRIRRAANILTETTTRGAEAHAILEPILPALNARSDETALQGLTNDAIALEGAGRMTDALRTAQSAVDRFSDSNDPKLTLAAMSAQVSVAVDGQHYQEGFAYSKTAVDFWEKQGRPLDPVAMNLWGDTAIAREFSGDTAGAEEAYRRAIEIGDRIFSHPTVTEATIIGIYGTFLVIQSRDAEAEVQVRRALQMTQSIYGEDDSRTAQSVYAMSRLYGARADYPEAIGWATKAIDLYKKDPHSQMLARTLASRARYYVQSGDLKNADADLAAALQEQEALSGTDSPGYAWVLGQAVNIQLHAKKYEEVVLTVDRMRAIYAKVGGSLLQDDLGYRFFRAKALAGLGRRDEALTELKDIEPAYAKIAPTNSLRFSMAELRAILLSQAARTVEAHDAAVEALQLPKPAQDDAELLAQLQKIARTKIDDRASAKN